MVLGLLKTIGVIVISCVAFLALVMSTMRDDHGPECASMFDDDWTKEEGEL